jgi:hypothetical protein
MMAFLFDGDSDYYDRLASRRDYMGMDHVRPLGPASESRFILNRGDECRT